MSVEYHINLRDELITLTASGDVSSSEACVCIDEMLNDAEFDPTLPQLVDLRTALPVGSDADLGNFERVLLGDYGPRLNASVAIVVNAEWTEDQCAKAFWLSCALHRAELFDDWNQACKWLIKREFTQTLSDLQTLAEAAASDPQEVAQEPATTDTSAPAAAEPRSPD